MEDKKKKIVVKQKRGLAVHTHVSAGIKADAVDMPVATEYASRR